MKKSELNLKVIENFILHITHSSDVDDTTVHTFTTSELYEMAEEYIDEDHVDGRETPDDDVPSKTYFLFGKKAVEIYVDETFPMLISKINECTITTFCFNSETDSLNELLSAYEGNEDFVEITELEYNILNDIE